jgi:hypothetical protein
MATWALYNKVGFMVFILSMKNLLKFQSFEKTK